MNKTTNHRGLKSFVYVVILAFVSLLVWAGSQMFAHNIFSPARKATHSLRVLTYNTHRMGMYKKPNHNLVISYLQQCDADILCLQEVEVHKNAHYLTLSDLKQALKKYPYTYFDFSIYNKKRQFGNAVFSKYPLVNKHTIRYESKANISSCCDMVINGDTLRLFINHLESNKLNQSDFESFFANNNTELKEEELTKKMTRAGLTRKQQAQKVKQAIKQSPHPCIVVGDFNAIPLSQTYQTIKRGLYDCFLETNFGKLGNTFYKFHIGIRIDYILCSKQLIPLACKVDKVSHSDHYPVIADIGWKK